MFNLTTPRKTCTKCGETKPATTEYFRVKSAAKDGLTTICKDCLKAFFRNDKQENPDRYKRLNRKYRDQNRGKVQAKKKEYYEKNKESIQARNRKNYEKNKDRYQASQKRYVEANKENVVAYHKEYYEANKAKFAAANKANYEANKAEISAKTKEYRLRNRESIAAGKRRYYEANKAQEVARADAWNKANPEKAKASAAKTRKSNPGVSRSALARRRARKANLPDTFTAQDWQRCLSHFSGCCAVCGRSTATLAMDHWIPLSSPDCTGTIPANIVPLCHGDLGCNNRKADKDALTWLVEAFGEKEGRQIFDKVQAYFSSLNSV